MSPAVGSPSRDLSTVCLNRVLSMRSCFLWNRRVPVALVTVVLAGCSVAWFLGHNSFTPSGTYYDKYVGSEGPSYWVFRGGKVELHAPGTDKDPGGICVEDMGTYLHTNEGWIMRGGPTDPEIVLKPGLFGIRTICPSRSYLNRYLPRRGFAWIPVAERADEPRQ